MDDSIRSLAGAGDYLLDCVTPVIPEDFGTNSQTTGVQTIRDLVILTQSCDLAASKISLVVLCPVQPVSELMKQPNYEKPKSLEPIRQGRLPALHLLANPRTPSDNLTALYVDFREVITLPIGYLARHAEQFDERFRLQSPYVEHLAQAFARFFMRVGLPSDIAPYK